MVELSAQVGNITVKAVSLAELRDAVAGIVGEELVNDVLALAPGVESSIESDAEPERPMTDKQWGMICRLVAGAGFTYDQATRFANLEVLDRPVERLKGSLSRGEAHRFIQKLQERQTVTDLSSRRAR